MKGHVEIFEVVDGKTKLVYEDHNLIVDGAGETIVDMLAFSPGYALSSDDISTTANTVVERALDTSNFIIRGLTFGKGSVGYRTNAHTYKKHNLIPSSEGIDSLDYYGASAIRTFGKHRIDLSSDVFKITSTSANSGGYVEWPASLFDSDYVDSIGTLPKCFSMDIKLDLEDPPKTYFLSPPDGQPQPLYSTIEIVSNGRNYVYTMYFLAPDRAKPAEATLQGRLVLLPEDYLDAAPSLKYGNIHCAKDLGNGWYRIHCIIPEPDSYTSNDLKIRFYPCSNEKFSKVTNAWELTGSMLIARPSLNIGSLPINYYLQGQGITTSSTELADRFPLTPSSIVSKEEGIYMTNDLGTITNTDVGYNVSASLPNMPHPNDTKLEEDVVTSYGACVDANVDFGHNSNLLQFVGTSGTKYNLTRYLTSDWNLLSNGITLSSTLQKDLRWFGCYADEANDPAYLVDEYTQASYESPLRTKTSSGTRINSLSSMDDKGYLRAYYKTLGEASDSIAKLYVNAESDFSSTGKVTYSVTLNAVDRDMLNYFGGVFEMGLYTLDQQQTRKNEGIDFSRSIDVDPIDGDDLSFRLFAQKSFNYDITHSDSFANTDSLIINWTIDFL